MNLLYVAFLFIFVSGLFFTSFEREQHLNNKIMYVAEDFMREEFDKKNWTISTCNGSRFKDTIVSVTVDEQTYFLIYSKGEIVDFKNQNLFSFESKN